ncbi:hypothetical protein SEA_SKYSAND_7 [Gordonia phage Skysand]|uniref:Uncharacterized protein n=1 Tax=Gordonia phage Skysand TaxID=2301559 RepID=A0A385DRN4_9CAUD|nr:hypothetical protein KNU08_gp07 [Gordonia phage Skysand]AXQ62041.1 hypothetical protein SEA_SKYSAND_7 [Gordonia phage Skysand]
MNHVPDDDEFGTEAHELLERYLGIREEAAQGRMEDLKRVMAPSNPFLPLGAPLPDDDYPLIPIGYVGADEFEGPQYPPLRVVEAQNPGFPIRFSSLQVSFPRRCGKEEMRGIIGKARAGMELSPEEYDRANQVFRHFAEAMQPVIRQFAEQMRSLADVVQQTALENPDVFSDGPVHPKDVRDERGIKRPSTKPPMWANDPTKGRRRR